MVAAESQDEPPSYIVLEGNRRVSALKALRDPTIVPGHEAEVRSLLKRYAVEAENLPERIRVIVVPDRGTAAPPRCLIAHWHLQEAVEPRPTSNLLLLTRGRAERFMKMAVMRRFLAAAPFIDRILQQDAASDDLAMSAFEYAYRSKDIAAAIEAEFDRDGMLLPRSSTPEKIASKLPKKKLGALEYLVVRV